MMRALYGERTLFLLLTTACKVRHDTSVQRVIRGVEGFVEAGVLHSEDLCILLFEQCVGGEVCHLDRRSLELPKAGPRMTFSIGMLFVPSPSSHSPPGHPQCLSRPHVLVEVLAKPPSQKESRRINLSKAWVEAPTR